MSNKIPILLFLTISTWVNHLSAQNFEFQWVNQFGSNSTDVTSIDIDPSGNVIEVGTFVNTADFHPGTDSVLVTSQGQKDIFFQKINSSGELIWVKTIGNSQQEWIYDVVFDALGNFCIVGVFFDTLDFDPGPGVTEVQGNYLEGYVAKYDSNGDFIWVKNLPVTNGSYISEIDIDQNGDLYIGGVFTNTQDFDPGPGSHLMTSKGNKDVFVLKLDADGNFIWAKSFGGLQPDLISDIGIDPFGNVWTTGTFRDTVDFDPNLPIFYLDAGVMFDMFVHKMDANGNLLTVVNVGSTSDVCQSNDLDFDLLGNVYVTGDYDGAMDFDPGFGVYTLGSNSGWDDSFLLKMDNSALFLWAHRIGDNADYIDRGWSIEVDSSGNSYSIGTVGDITWPATIDFDPGPGTFQYTPADHTMYMIKFDDLGNFQWVKFIEIGSDWDIAEIKLLNDETAFIGGEFSGTVDFDPGNQDYFKYTSGPKNGYLLKLGNCNANDTIPDPHIACDTYTWIDGVTYTSSNDQAVTNATWGCNLPVVLDLVIHNSDTVIDIISSCDSSFTWINGTEYFSNNNTDQQYYINQYGCDSVIQLNLTFDSNSSSDVLSVCDSLQWSNGVTYYTNTMTSDTLTNVFGCDSIIYLDLTILETHDTDVVVACDSLVWSDGNTYYTNTNSVIDTLLNIIGCDSIVLLDLTINSSNSSTDYYSLCQDQFTWIDGNTYFTNNNTATYVVTNSIGCDSVISLDLSLNNSTGTDVIHACDDYTWIDGNTYFANNNTATYIMTNSVGCDSVISLDLTLDNNSGTAVIQACDEYTWINGVTYTSSNNSVSYVLTNMAGCDSVVYLDLTIDPPIISTTYANYTITSNAMNSDYQWLDCNDNYASIFGATAQSYMPSANGSYAVEVTTNGCTDTSDCIFVVFLSMYDMETEEPLIYPNPSSGQIMISFPLYGTYTIRLRDMSGKILEEVGLINGKNIELNFEKAAGTYLIECSDENGLIARQKIILTH